jgi:hypothetical protein
MKQNIQSQMKKRVIKKKENLSPPSLTTSLSVGHTFRFQAVAASAGFTFTTTFLGDLMCVAATTTSAYQLANAVKLRKIEMWGPPSSSLVPVTVSADFAGSTSGAYGPSRIRSDTSVGATRVAHLVVKPPKDSQVSQWQSAISGNQLATLVFPAGAIIDIHYTMTVRDTASVQAVTGAVAGATVGQVYVRALDSPSGTANLPPISYITI